MDKLIWDKIIFLASTILGFLIFIAMFLIGDIYRCTWDSGIFLYPLLGGMGIGLILSITFNVTIKHNLNEIIEYFNNIVEIINCYEWSMYSCKNNYNGNKYIRIHGLDLCNIDELDFLFKNKAIYKIEKAILKNREQIFQSFSLFCIELFDKDNNKQIYYYDFEEIYMLFNKDLTKKMNYIINSLMEIDNTFLFGFTDTIKSSLSGIIEMYKTNEDDIQTLTCVINNSCKIIDEIKIFVNSINESNLELTKELERKEQEYKDQLEKERLLKIENIKQESQNSLEYVKSLNN